MAISTSQPTAQQISRTGGFDLDCSADTALPFFTPEGEREWIPTWHPKPVFPAEAIPFRRDTVFREGEGNEEAVWTILDADWNIRRAEYVRAAPASHAAHIVVKVDSITSDRCQVTVSYTITVFGDCTGKLLDAFSESNYAARMNDWQRQVTDCLRARR